MNIILATAILALTQPGFAGGPPDCGLENGWKAFDPTVPGPFLRAELKAYADHGHIFNIDESLDLRPAGEPIKDAFFVPGQSYRDLELHYKADEVASLADRLAQGVNVPRGTLLRILRENESRGMVEVSTLLPPSLQERLGTGGKSPLDDCFGASFNFHKDTRWEWTTPGMRLSDLRQRHVKDFVRGDKLQFGTLISVILIYPSIGGLPPQPFTIHVATYLGGDFIFHKYGPFPSAKYEFHTVEGLLRFYTLAKQKRLPIRPDLPRRWDFQVALNFARWR